jgi:hypothetical protein
VGGMWHLGMRLAGSALRRKRRVTTSTPKTTARAVLSS